MLQTSLKYPAILFDWGDTIMYDDPTNTTPMVDWPAIRIVEGVAELLAYLHSTGRHMILATSASVSDENQIRGALARADIDQYFSRVFCFKNTGLSKGESFYRHVLKEINFPAGEVMMVGDSFEKDVQAANMVGVFAAWFNQISEETHDDVMHVTVHSMLELQNLFKTWDKK